MFTANEAATAIHNRPELDADFEDRFERAAFAAYLAENRYGYEAESAAEFIEELASTYTYREGERVRQWFAELQDFRTYGTD